MSIAKLNNTAQTPANLGKYDRYIDPKEMPVPVFCRIIGFRNARIHKYISEGMPVVAQGGQGVPSIINAPVCVRWIIDLEVGRSVAKYKEIADDGTLAREQYRLKKAQADHKELMVDVLRGDVVNIADIRAMLHTMMAMLRMRIMDLPGRLASDLSRMDDQVAINHYLDKECTRILNSAAESLREYSESQFDESEDEIVRKAEEARRKLEEDIDQLGEDIDP